MKKIQSVEMEDFKRPDHPDFKDALELAKEKWSGLRMNRISGDMELWMLGRLERTVSQSDLDEDPHAVQKVIAEAFALEAVLPDTPNARAYGQERDRLANAKAEVIYVDMNSTTKQ